MIKTISNALGAVANVVGKIGSAINKHPAFKGLKFFASATVGIQLALVGTAVASVAWAGIKVAGILDSKIIKSQFLSSIAKDTDWTSSLESTEKFIRSMWGVGLYSHSETWKIIRENFREKKLDKPQIEPEYDSTESYSKNPLNFTNASNDYESQQPEAISEAMKPSPSPSYPFLATQHGMVGERTP